MFRSFRVNGGVTSFIVGVLISACHPAALAQGTVFTYQGQLKFGGAPTSGAYDMTFRLFDTDAVGTQVGLDVALPGVNVANGLFTAPLDFGAGVFDGSPRWLEIEVNTVVLSPHQPLTSAPYAQTATNAAQLNGQSAAFYQNASSLDGGTLADARLDGTYSGVLTLSNAGNVFAGDFSGSGAGLTSVNADLLDGLNSTAFLQSIPFPLTLIGWSGTHVIKGETDSYYDGATEVVGIANSYSAVFGYTFGVSGASNGWYGCGVRGRANNTAGPGFGVWGVAASTNGYGVLGQASSATGNTYGVWGASASSSGDGVVGQATAPSGTTYGVVGESFSTNGRGVYGHATATSGLTYGVLGQATVNGWAVYALGDLGVSGWKNFRIDHPFDPENKYLLHYSTESPSPQNFYSGNVVTDANGYASVELPEYFAAINANCKYQLTVIGKVFAQAIVSEEIVANRFQIRTSAPSVKVSWRVEADRNDLNARSKKPKDVLEKEGLERGTYQHPEVYGQPPERGMNFDATRRRPSPEHPSSCTSSDSTSSSAAAAATPR